MSDKETARKIHNWMLGGVHADIANCELCDQIAELLAVESRAPAPQPAQRSDKDYAIEHAEYLAKAAEHLMDEINKYDMAESADEEGDCDARSGAWNGLRSAIGEFRKRAKRATPHPPKIAESSMSTWVR